MQVQRVDVRVGWQGGEGCVTGLHSDDEHNVLLQVPATLPLSTLPHCHTATQHPEKVEDTVVSTGSGSYSSWHFILRPDSSAVVIRIPEFCFMEFMTCKLNYGLLIPLREETERLKDRWWCQRSVR